MLTLLEIAHVVNAKNDVSLYPDSTVTGVEFDSRKIEANNLFVPLKGQRDGHEFIQLARENGASVSFWAEDQKLTPPEDFPVIVVTDVLVAMQALAHYFVKKINPRVVGVTGSNGKTTTKDMLDAVLSQKFQTYKTQGNYNNDIGLPYTILHMPLATEVLVLEMGMNHPNEISPLSLIAEPELAAITIIGESHMEFLGSRLGIAKAKMEIVDGLQANGELIVPGNEPLLTDMLKDVQQKVVTFGQVGNEEISAVVTSRTKNSVTFTVTGDEFMIPVVGDYNVNNALIAIEAGRYFGLTTVQIKQGLATLHLTQSRAEWQQAWNGAAILNDAYNANPTAMRLVLETFSQIELTEDGKRIAVLGDMGELGESSKEMHEAMIEAIDFEKIHHLVLFGDWMQYLANDIEKQEPLVPLDYFTLAEKDAMIEKLKEILKPSDLLLLKGSNSMKLYEIAEKISEK